MMVEKYLWDKIEISKHEFLHMIQRIPLLLSGILCYSGIKSEK